MVRSRVPLKGPGVLCRVRFQVSNGLVREIPGKCLVVIGYCIIQRAYGSIDARCPGSCRADMSAPGQRGFHQPTDLTRFKRRRTIVGCARFESIQPFFRFGNAADDYERQRRPLLPHLAQQRQVLRRFTAGKYNVHCRSGRAVRCLAPSVRSGAVPLRGHG